jgi:regulator of RNase E activity RraA
MGHELERENFEGAGGIQSGALRSLLARGSLYPPLHRPALIVKFIFHLKSGIGDSEEHDSITAAWKSGKEVDLDAKQFEALHSVTTATITTVLLKKGLRNVWLRGTVPLRDGQSRVVGSAFTLRFVPAREDLATPESWNSPISTRAAIEAMPPNCVAVVDAMGITDAGIFGDILCARMKQRKVAALITDGVVRDVAGVISTRLPVWCRGTAAPPSVSGLTFVAWQQPIGCGGVAVFPDDVIVADEDGAVVIPKDLVAEVTTLAIEQEKLETWIMDQVQAGAALPGLYPANAENKARFEEFCRKERT